MVSRRIATRRLVLLVGLVLVAGCRSVAETPPAYGGASQPVAAHPCAPLLDHHGFAGYSLLPDSEPAGTGTKAWLCDFAETKYRNNTIDALPIRQITYDVPTDTWREYRPPVLATLRSATWKGARAAS